MTNAERSKNFNDTTGAISWNRRHAARHPHACKCNLKEHVEYAGTPHKHYDKPPFMCARCSCVAYDPLYPAPDAAFITANYRTLIALETS